MLASEHPLAEGAGADARALDPAARSLLDHVAAELAAEYIRLMEVAAETETREPGTS
jgi:hypothetical protein